MNIAIIGANGFVGARLVESLHLGGCHVVVPIVRRPSALALSARFAVTSPVAPASPPVPSGQPGPLQFRIADALDPVALAAHFLTS
ncbi:MAG: hypothetical protein H7067_02660 [Burkholderiales bacterium]|nr:hypothetical protein [Opitutaceae bacterium]